MEYAKEKELNELGEKLRKEYKEVIVDFIVFDKQKGQMLIQKRSANRRLFPGVWEFPGGLLEPQETLVACIKRNIHEECQMQLERIIGLVHLFTWDEDKDVATAQFLVEASGTYTLQKDKVSDGRFIDHSELSLLLSEGETPIYRGAFYAFEYLERNYKSFESVLFFDKLVTEFFAFLHIKEVAPKIVIDGEKRFTIDKGQGILSISPNFLKEYGSFACGNIVLHQLYHNYCQGILAFDDVKAIRNFLGNNAMFYVDIVADTYTFLFLSARYGFSNDDYLKICFDSLQEYRADAIEESKLTRLIGTALTLESCGMGKFTVILPALDGKENKLFALQFDKYLRYKSVSLDKSTVTKLKQIFVKGNVTEEMYLKTIKNIQDTFNNKE